MTSETDIYTRQETDATEMINGDAFLHPLDSNGDKLDEVQALIYQLDNQNLTVVESGLTQSPVLIHQARCLQTQRLNEVGIIPDEVIEDGIVSDEADPSVNHSNYFIARNGNNNEILAAVRQIYAKDDDIDSIHFFQVPTVKDFSEMVKSTYHASEVVEISQLAKKRGESRISTLHLYRDMMKHSINSGHKLWVMTVAPQEYNILEFLFEGVLDKVGEEHDMPIYNGFTKLVPVALDVQAARDKYIDYTISLSEEEKNNMLLIMRAKILNFFGNLREDIAEIE